LALVEEGDEVIYPNPGFPIYESMINFLSGKAVPIPLREENDFRLDVNELAGRSEEHTSELQSLTNLVCRLLLEKKKKIIQRSTRKIKNTGNRITAITMVTSTRLDPHDAAVR